MSLFQKFKPDISWFFLIFFSANAEEGKIGKIDIPKNKSQLNLNQDYQWSVFLLCNYKSELNSQNIESFQESYDLMNEPWITAKIKRIATPSSLLSSVLTFNLAREYAKNGLWFDYIAVLIELRQLEPNNTKYLQAWEDLLQAEGINSEIINTGL